MFIKRLLNAINKLKEKQTKWNITFKQKEPQKNLQHFLFSELKMFFFMFITNINKLNKIQFLQNILKIQKSTSNTRSATGTLRWHR